MARQRKTDRDHEEEELGKEVEKEKYEEIGIRLIGIREVLGYSVKDMAENLELNYETYRNYERGISNIPLKVLKALREKFHVNLNYLVAGDGTAFSLRSNFPIGKSYFIGDSLRKLREMLSLSTSEILSYLDTLDSEAKLIDIEKNLIEAKEEIIEDICESFSVNPAWFIGRGLSVFRTRKVSLGDLEKVCRTEYSTYRPEILFTAECRNESEAVYFALFLKGEKPYQGILLYEDADLALWRTWLSTASELREALQFAYYRGMYSVYVLDRDTFHEIVTGRLHSIKAIEKGKPPTFPFMFALFDESIRKYLPSPESKVGSSDYGLLRIIKTLTQENISQ